MQMGWWKLNEDHSVEYVGEGVDAVRKCSYDNTEARRVGKDSVGDYRVSTVFLALNHNYSDKGPPILFETMVFVGDSCSDVACVRYCTWLEAETGHAIFVKGLQWAKTTNLMDDAERFESFLNVLQTRAGDPPASDHDWKDFPENWESDVQKEETND